VFENSDQETWLYLKPDSLLRTQAALL